MECSASGMNEIVAAHLPLKNVLVPAYWSEPQTDLTKFGICKELIPIFRRAANIITIPDVLPEHVVMYETIWMLRGLRGSTVYKINDDDVSFCGCLSLLSVGMDATRELLLSYCDCGTTLRRMRRFLSDTRHNYPGAHKDQYVSVHIQFIDHLSSFLQEFDEHLAMLQSDLQNYVNQGLPYGLLFLNQDLKAWCGDIVFIGQILSSVVFAYGADEQSSTVLEYLLLDGLMASFIIIWKTNNRTYGTVVWKLLSIVLRKHGAVKISEDSLISESGIYGDLVQFIHQQLEKPFPVPNNTVHLKLPVTESIENPLLALHFALMRPQSRKPFV